MYTLSWCKPVIGILACLLATYQLSLLYNRGKTDGLMHTSRAFVPKVLGFESYRFTGGKLYRMVNRDNNLVAIRSLVQKLLGQRSFSKVSTGMHISHIQLVANIGLLPETATLVATHKNWRQIQTRSRTTWDWCLVWTWTWRLDRHNLGGLIQTHAKLQRSEIKQEDLRYQMLHKLLLL